MGHVLPNAVNSGVQGITRHRNQRHGMGRCLGLHTGDIPPVTLVVWSVLEGCLDD